MRQSNLVDTERYDMVVLDYKGVPPHKLFNVAGSVIREKLAMNEREKLGEEIRWYTPYKFKHVK